MLNAEEIRNITFSNSMKGYKKEEVDILLDKIEADYEQFARQMRIMQEKNSELAKQLAETNSSKDSIQTVLLSAQKLADQIIGDARKKADEILEQAQAELENYKANKQQMMEDIDKEFLEKKAENEKAVALMEAECAAKRAAMEDAAKQSVDKQQAIFDRLKIEASAFKSDMLSRCKALVLALNDLPDQVPMDAQRAAAAVAAEFENKPEVKAQEEEKEPETQEKEPEVIEEKEPEEESPVQMAIEEEEETEEKQIIADDKLLL